jgi:hypothetical protein
MSATDYLAKAERCEQLARDASDESMQRLLHELSHRFVEEAQEAAGREGGTTVSGIRDPATLREAAERCLKAAALVPSGTSSERLQAAAEGYRRWAEQIEVRREREMRNEYRLR